MNLNENTLLDNKDFILAVAKDLINPNPSNDNLKAILSAAKEIEALNTADVLIGCSTCLNIYKDSFKLILAYCETNNWFTKVITKTKK